MRVYITCLPLPLLLFYGKSSFCLSGTVFSVLEDRSVSGPTLICEPNSLRRLKISYIFGPFSPKWGEPPIYLFVRRNFFRTGGPFLHFFKRSACILEFHAKCVTVCVYKTFIRVMEMIFFILDLSFTKVKHIFF